MSCVFLGAEMWKFFHLQTRCPLQFLTPKQFPTLVAGFSLPSWLIFTGSFSFHFSKLPRQNFLQKFCHPFKEGEFFTFSTLKTIDARFARAKKHLQNLSLLRSSTSKRTIFLQTFCSYGTFF